MPTTRIDQVCNDLATLLAEVNQKEHPDKYHAIGILPDGKPVIVSGCTHVSRMIKDQDGWVLYEQMPTESQNYKVNRLFIEALSAVLFARLLYEPFAMAALTQRLAEIASDQP